MTAPRIALLADAGSVHTVRWARGLADRGHDVHVVSLHEPSPDLTGVPVHRLSASAPQGYFLGAHAVRQRLRALGSVILHAHYATGYGTLGRLAGHHPFVLSVWGSDVLSFPDRSPVHRALVAANLGALKRMESR